jgi:TRAP-type C4-dicarboxylate transport system permease small subunit
MDMGIDVLITKASAKVEKSIRFAVDLVLLAINGYIFYMAIIFTNIAWVKPTAVLGVSSAVVNSALIVGFGLITLHTIRFLHRDVTAYLGKGEI